MIREAGIPKVLSGWRDTGNLAVQETARPGIITERDVLNSVAAGQAPDGQRVADNSTADVVTVSVDASLEQAVQKMTEGDFRHLLVVYGDDAVGIVSMRPRVRLTGQ